MSRKLMCPNGHHWDPDSDSAQSSCPVCGAAATRGDWNDDTKTAAVNPDLLPPPPRVELDGASNPRPRDDSPPEEFGRYKILRTLGRGGMGAVYLAHDHQLDRRVALKVPHFSSPHDPRVIERFTQEARAAATLDHPNICSVYDVGEIGGFHYLTMAYIEGQTLADLIRGNEKPLGQPGVADLIRKLALALEEAHSHGVVHRDLKPANIMINQRLQPVIMDFGLARRSGGSDSHLTAVGAVMGTPAYMSPEQVAGDQQKIGPATDIYALGVILYEMLAGRLPFDGSVGEVFSQIATQDPPSLSELRHDLDPQLAEVCLKALNKPIEERFTSMAEFADALQAYLTTRTGPSRQSKPASIAGDDAPAPHSVTSDASSDGDSMQLAAKLLASLAARIDSGELSEDSVLALRRRRPWWVWAIAVSAVTALIVLAVVPFLKSPEPPKTPVIVRVEQFTQYVNAVYIIDGKEFTKEQLKSPVELTVGPHELLVKQDGKVIARKSFEVPGDHDGQDGEPISVTPDPVDPTDLAGKKTGGDGPKNGQPDHRKLSLPKFPVDASLEVWAQKSSRSRTNPLHSQLRINGQVVDTFEDRSQWTVSKRIDAGTWNEFTLLTKAQQPIKGANHLTFGVGPVTKTANGERMSPIVWDFVNNEGWELKNGQYQHRTNEKVVAVKLQFYYGNLKHESRKPASHDYVISSRGASRSRNPSVTATVFVNGTPLTTFSTTPRRAVITDLLKQGSNTIKIVTHRVEGSLTDNDIRIQMSGPAVGSQSGRRGVLWLSALTGWQRDAKGKLITGKGESKRLEREVSFYLPDPVGVAGNDRIPELAVFARRNSQYYESSLHSEIRIRSPKGTGKLAARFSSDSSASLDGQLRKNAWNELTIRTVAADPPARRVNPLKFYFGVPQRRSNGLTMPQALWVFQNDAAFQKGKGWELRDGRLVNGKVREVEHAYHVYLGDLSYEKQQPMKGDYALICGPPTSGRVPSVTATAYINGTPLTTFAGAQRTVILRPPLIKKGVNEIRVVTKRVDNSGIDGDFRFVIGGPAASKAPRYPRIKEFSAMKGWVRKADGSLENPENPGSNTMERVIRFQVK